MMRLRARRTHAHARTRAPTHLRQQRHAQVQLRHALRQARQQAGLRHRRGGALALSLGLWPRGSARGARAPCCRPPARRRPRRRRAAEARRRAGADAAAAAAATDEDASADASSRRGAPSPLRRAARRQHVGQRVAARCGRCCGRARAAELAPQKALQNNWLPAYPAPLRLGRGGQRRKSALCIRMGRRCEAQALRGGSLGALRPSTRARACAALAGRRSRRGVQPRRSPHAPWQARHVQRQAAARLVRGCSSRCDAMRCSQRDARFAPALSGTARCCRCSASRAP